MVEQTEPFFVPLERRGVLGIGGSEARTFLQNLISNDVRRLAADTALYALLLTPQGKYLHDFFLVEHADPRAGTTLLLDVEGDRAADLLRRFTLYRLRADVVLADLSARYAAGVVIGAGERLGLSAEEGSARQMDDGVVFVDPRRAALGARFLLPQDRVAGFAGAYDVRRGKESEYEALRLREGIPDSSRDLAVERSFPLEAALDELHAIDYGKGCYVGQELTARTHYRGTVRKRLMPVRIDGATPAPGTPVMFGAVEAGEMRSSSGSMGMALLRLEALEAAQATSGALRAGDATIIPQPPEWLARTLPAPDAVSKR
jgi:folate-binding protein YgfZ